MIVNETEMDRLAGKMTDLCRVMERLNDKVTRTETTSQVSINAGGMGVWVATTACVVMLAVNMLFAMMLFDQKRKIDDLNDYLNAIYMMAPSLKPPEKAQ